MVSQNTSTESYKLPPAGMVEVRAIRSFNFHVSGTEIEPVSPQIFAPLAFVPDWSFKILGSSIPVDVQYPWESHPTKWHFKHMPIPRFFIDRHLVSVADYGAYLAA